VKAGLPPVCRKWGRMSGVLTKKFGRKKLSVSVDSSFRYSSISHFSFRHVK
jgi:hypothetical protein